jgi:hypothetical protein
MFTISRAVFSKALSFASLHAEFRALTIMGLASLAAAVALLKKQES